MEISLNDYLRTQPSHTKVSDADKYYSLIASASGKIIMQSSMAKVLNEETCKDIALAIAGYFQDIVGDLGIWRWFTTLHNDLYGKPLPFYGTDYDYIESELNLADIKFLIWYIIEDRQQVRGFLSPFRHDIDEAATMVYTFLDGEYLSAPHPVDTAIAFGLDTSDPASASSIFELSQWLFWNCYMMKHSLGNVLREAHSQAQEIINRTPDKRSLSVHLGNLNDRIMMQNTCGPLALTPGEWLSLIIDNEKPSSLSRRQNRSKTHPDYDAFIEATDGAQIRTFKTCHDLSTFLAQNGPWKYPTEKFLKEHSNDTDFCVMAHPRHGLFIAPDCAQFIDFEGNNLYNSDTARKHGYTMVTLWQQFPAELTKFVIESRFADAWKLPYEPADTPLGKSILHAHHDFLLRLYQQRNYRHDLD